jgi:hypothetical protein
MNPPKNPYTEEELDLSDQEREGSDYDASSETSEESRIYDEDLDDQELLNYSERARGELLEFLKDIVGEYKDYEPNKYLFKDEPARKEEKTR